MAEIARVWAYQVGQGDHIVTPRGPGLIRRSHRLYDGTFIRLYLQFPGRRRKVKMDVADDERLALIRR